ncbi:MAG: hypothetical protein DDT22_00641 [candidate division WS2 bacterium]|nr:hypothetical protein [Candidatus Lithacetigena glycinireducens]MBT9174969.1 hypothetical protein [Candidatus Lithacetigena glycinireducens]
MRKVSGLVIVPGAGSFNFLCNVTLVVYFFPRIFYFHNLVSFQLCG